MRILIASNYHSSSYHGGNEVYTDQLARGLVEKGHEVIYLTGAAAPKTLTPYSLHVKETINIHGHLLPYLSWLKPLTINVDVVHTTGTGLPIWVTALIHQAKLKVHTFQGDSHPTSPIVDSLAKTMSRQTLQAHNVIITTTSYAKQKLKRRYPNLDIVTIPLASPNNSHPLSLSSTQAKNKLSWNPNKKHLLFVGKLDQHHYYKGLDILFDSLPNLPSEFKLTVVGEGPLRPAFQQRAADKHLSSRVTFVGHVSDDHIPYYFKGADAFILPSTSDSEGFGLVILEAMLQKTPVITTTAIASSTFFSQRGTIIQVPPNNPQLLSQAILATVKQPPQEIIKRAYTLALSLTPEAMVNRTIALYRQYLN